MKLRTKTKKYEVNSANQLSRKSILRPMFLIETTRQRGG